MMSLTIINHNQATPMLSFEDFVAANPSYPNITMFEYNSYALVRALNPQLSFDSYMAYVRDRAFIAAIDTALSDQDQEALKKFLAAFIVGIEDKSNEMIRCSLVCIIENACKTNNALGLQTIMQFVRENKKIQVFEEVLGFFRFQTKVSKALNPSLYAFVESAMVFLNVIDFKNFGLEVPEHFKDEFTNSLINCPVKLGDHVFDFDTLDMLDIQSDGTRKNPFNRQPFTMADVQPHAELYAEMRAAVSNAQQKIQEVLYQMYKAIVEFRLDDLKVLVAANPMLNINQIVRSKFTLLHYACLKENADAIRFLVQCGAEMDLSYTTTDLSPHNILHLKNPHLALEMKLFCVLEAQSRTANNDPLGHLRLATMCMRGIIVEPDPASILFHLEAAGDYGDVSGYMHIADVLAKGLYEVERDVAKAVNFYQRAIDDYNYEPAKVKKLVALMPTHGLNFHSTDISTETIVEMAQDFDPDAQYLYSVMLRAGIGVTANEYNRTKYLGFAAKAGCIPAMFEYSSCCQYGVIIPRNITVAVENLKKAADGGHNHARYNYATDCLYGNNGVRVDFQLAVKYLKDAADDGFAPAQYSFSRACANGHGVPAVDPIRAAVYMQKAADNKMPKAQQEFAHMCMTGLGAKQNKFKAARYYIMIAENPEHDIGVANKAAQAYAKMCLTGDGIPQDDDDAAKYFKMAADRGCMDSAYNYAKLCAEDRVFDKGSKEAVVYFKMAADAGHAIAQYMFAKMCRRQLEGLSIEQAVIYYKMCVANQNIRGTIGLAYSNKAATEYALMCLNGEEIEHDMEEALKYLRIAANRECIEAAQKLQELEGEGERPNITIPDGPSI